MLEHFVTVADGSAEVAYTKLKALMAPFVLRRKKVDALHQMLPPKTSEVVRLPFDTVSQDIYDGILSEFANSKKIDQRAYSNIYTQLRKASNNPLLLRTRWKDAASVNQLVKWTMANDYWGTNKSLTEDLVRSEVREAASQASRKGGMFVTLERCSSFAPRQRRPQAHCSNLLNLISLVVVVPARQHVRLRHPLHGP